MHCACYNRYWQIVVRGTGGLRKYDTCLRQGKVGAKTPAGKRDQVRGETHFEVSRFEDSKYVKGSCINR